MHGEQRRHAVEACAIPDRRWHRHHRTSSKSSDHTGEGTFHASDDNDSIGSGHPVNVGEQSMQPSHSNIVETISNNTVSAQCERRLVRHGHIGRAGGDDQHPWLWLAWLRRPIQHASRRALNREAVVKDGSHCLDLRLGRTGQQHRSVIVLQQFTNDGNALLRTLARSVDGFGHSLAKRPMMIDESVTNFNKGQPSELCHGLISSNRSSTNRLDQFGERGCIHSHIVARRRATAPSLARVNTANNDARPSTDAQRVAFFGPFGTFTEQALRTQGDLAAAELIPLRTVPDVLDAVSSGEVDLGFVPIENSIEGMVNFTLDSLAFDHDLVITREVVLDIHLCLAAPAGTSMDDITDVMSIPIATAQCHRFLREHLPNATIRAATSTAGAAKSVAEDGAAGLAAIAPRVAAELYGLEVLAADIEDESGNQTRFVVVSRDGVPAPSGHDRTGLVVFQRADEPGSLISILQEFAARRINLSNLISRPIKHGGLGEYCFIILAEGHVGDDLMADTMRSLHAKQASVKWFGSWPRADAEAHEVRAHADERWRQADDWIDQIRQRIN